MKDNVSFDWMLDFACPVFGVLLGTFLVLIILNYLGM